jgi:polar amino acid transport system ATP-binding protein
MFLKVTDLSKRYGSHAALDGVSFSTPENAGTIVLLGPSGSGKSTLLRVLGSLLVPDEGEASIEGKVLSWSEAAALQQRRLNGFVFQGFNLFPHLTAHENVALPLRVVHALSADQALVTSRAALARFGMPEHAGKKPAELSGGQQQRVALARAIAPNPRLLLLDEPTSALDPMMTQEVLDLIGALAAGGQQIVLSTHEISFARQVADWVVFLDLGRVVESSPAGDFFAHPKTELAKRFLETLSRYR